MSVVRRPNDGLFDFLDKAGNFVLANLLWVLLSIPLVTLPIATAGLFATMSPWSRGKPVEVFRDFFGGMRQYWRKAMLIGLIDVLLGGLVILNFSIFRLMKLPQPLTLVFQSLTLFVGMTVILVNLYLWPLLVTLDFPLRNLMETALKLVFAHPFASIGMLLGTLVLLLGSTLLPAIFLLLASFSACALFSSWGAWRVVRGYIAEDERSRLESRH